MSLRIPRTVIIVLLLNLIIFAVVYAAGMRRGFFCASLDRKRTAPYYEVMSYEGASSIDLIREAFLYQSRFAGKTMVFKIDFPVTQTAGFPYLMKDIALLAKTGIKVVIVPGASEYIDLVLKEHNLVSSFVEDERITTENMIQYVEMAAFHAATRFITALSASRVDALIGNFVRARGRGVVNGCDLENTGVVDKIFAEAIIRILDAGMIPILPCIGWSPAGKPYNVPSNGIALSACEALKAIKLVVVSADYRFDTKTLAAPDTVEKNEAAQIIRLNLHEARSILAMNTGAAVSASKTHCLSALNLALSALNTGVERVHIIDANEEGAILRELFSNLGAGTMVYADEYEAIRGIRNADIPDILRLMEPLMQKGMLLRRNTEDIQQQKDDYAVFVIDGAIHACAALHDWGEGQAEIAALAADLAYSKMGAGRRLVRYLIEKAASQGCTRVFALTTSTHDWFEKLGFREVAVETLPTLKRERYDRKRNSKVFALDI